MGQIGGATRRHDIDFIRVVVFGLLMIYHTSLIFGTHPWLLSADIPSRSFDLISLVSHPWRISLLFFISGMTTAALAKRLSPAGIRDMRTRQLIPPLLFGIFVLVPPQIYIAVRQRLDTQMSYLEFWQTYLRFGTIIDQNGLPIRLVSFEHLWFIAYLWLYTVVLTLCMLRGDWLVRLSGRLSGLLRGRGMLVWPIAYLALLRLAVYPIFGETMIVGNDWYAHLVYFGFFVFGHAMADDEAFWQTVVAYRWQAAMVAGLSLVLIVGLFIVYPPGERGIAITMLHRVGRSAFQWSAIVAILGICRVTITEPHPVIRYLNRAMLSYYVLHQTVMLLFAYWLKQTYGLGNGSFLMIVVATAACCMLLYEVQRRTARLLRGKGGFAADDPQAA
jgi:glucan biosynthesis protein C